MVIPTAGCGKDFRERPSDKKKLICTENYPLCPRCQAIQECREEIRKALNKERDRLEMMIATNQPYQTMFDEKLEEIDKVERVLLGKAKNDTVDNSKASRCKKPTIRMDGFMVVFEW